MCTTYREKQHLGCKPLQKNNVFHIKFTWNILIKPEKIHGLSKHRFAKIQEYTWQLQDFFHFSINKCIVELSLLFFFLFAFFKKKKISGCMHSNMLRSYHQSFPEFSFILLISFSCVLFLSAVTFNSRALCPASRPPESHLHFKSLLLRRGKLHQRKQFCQIWTALRKVTKGGGKPKYHSHLDSLFLD